MNIRTRPYVILLLSIVAWLANAQEGSDSSAPHAPGSDKQLYQFVVHHLEPDSGPESICGVRSLTGKPFTAKRTVVAPGDNDNSTDHGSLELIVARDAKGRVRCDNFGRGFNIQPKQYEVYIYDPIESLQTDYHSRWPDNRVATVLPLRTAWAEMARHHAPAMLLFMSGGNSALPMPNEAARLYGADKMIDLKALPTRYVDGLQVCGYRASFELSDNLNYSRILTIEQWVSLDYGIELRSSRREEAGQTVSGVVTEEVSVISFAEPTQSLFQIPNGFEIQTCKSRGYSSGNASLNC
jgi:hypothetical protein